MLSQKCCQRDIDDLPPDVAVFVRIHTYQDWFSCGFRSPEQHVATDGQDFSHLCTSLAYTRSRDSVEELTTDHVVFDMIEEVAKTFRHIKMSSDSSVLLGKANLVDLHHD